MSILFAVYSGVLVDALTAGAVIGALAGIVIFTAGSASEGLQRVIFGFLIGGVIMGVIQALRLGSALGYGVGSPLNPLLQAQSVQFGALLFDAILLTIQVALVGGLFMIVSLAPFRALKGALAGVVIGMVSALVSWGVLQFVDTAIPLVIFYILVLGIVLFIVENVPLQNL